MVKFDGTLLAQLRKQRGIFQRELGVRIGLRPEFAQQMISSWECGRHVPETNVLPLLAVVLECSITDFFGATAAAEQPALTTLEEPPASAGAA
jgi:transcriptional regulator with XRE-family HTH domain